MLEPVKPRGDTSVAFLSTGLYISELANICHGIHRQVRDVLHPYHSSRKLCFLQMCSICNAGTLLASVKARINLTDCCPVVMTGLVI